MDCELQRRWVKRILCKMVVFCPHADLVLPLSDATLDDIDARNACASQEQVMVPREPSSMSRALDTTCTAPPAGMVSRLQEWTGAFSPDEAVGYSEAVDLGIMAVGPL